MSDTPPARECLFLCTGSLRPVRSLRTPSEQARRPTTSMPTARASIPRTVVISRTPHSRVSVLVTPAGLEGALTRAGPVAYVQFIIRTNLTPTSLSTPAR